MDEQLTYLGEAPRSFTQVGDAFRQMLGPVNANLALPMFAAASAHDATVALLNLRAALFDLQSRYAPVLCRSGSTRCPRP